MIALKPGASVSAAELRSFFEPRVAKWWIPDDLVIVEELPHTATGKLLKLELRRLYGGETDPDAVAL